jgi:hypothetical protein
MRFGLETIMIGLQKIIQALRRLPDFFQRDAPAGAFGDWFRN